MRVTHRMIADTVNLNLMRSLRRLEIYSNQLSTGKVFQRASENPVGVGRVMGYNASIDRNEQYRLNMNQTKGWLENTETGLRNGLDVLQRVREQCIYGATESLTADDRRAIAPEIREFIEHFIGIANTETNGLYIFAGHQTLAVPYKQEKVYHVELAGGGLDPGYDLKAKGLQNGRYALQQEQLSPAGPEPATLSLSQEYLQGSAESIIGQAAFGAVSQAITRGTTGLDLTLGDGFVSGVPTAAFNLTLTFDEVAGQWHYTDEDGNLQFVAAGDLPFTYLGTEININELSGTPVDGDEITISFKGASASVLLEVTAADHETGEVSYRYLAHQYALDGNYEHLTGEFSLTFGDAAPQQVIIGETTIEIEGLGDMHPFLASGLKVGDKTTLNILPALADSLSYEQVNFTSNLRSGEPQASYIFTSGALDAQEVTFNAYSLDTFSRSPEKGTLYDGSLKVRYDVFAAAGPALTFSYDQMGFPVYYGDYNDHVQEISPHQEIIMNLSGDKAFGISEEVFTALFDVYWALIDNDRECLGNRALAQMDEAVDHLLGKLAEVGARSNRVEAMHFTLSTENLYLHEVRSNIEDIDLAQKITDYLMQENAYRAALSTASMMMQPSLVDYMR